MQAGLGDAAACWPRSRRPRLRAKGLMTLPLDRRGTGWVAASANDGGGGGVGVGQGRTARPRLLVRPVTAVGGSAAAVGLAPPVAMVRAPCRSRTGRLQGESLTSLPLDQRGGAAGRSSAPVNRPSRIHGHRAERRPGRAAITAALKPRLTLSTVRRRGEVHATGAVGRSAQPRPRARVPWAGRPPAFIRSCVSSRSRIWGASSPVPSPGFEPGSTAP